MPESPQGSGADPGQKGKFSSLNQERLTAAFLPKHGEWLDQPSSGESTLQQIQTSPDLTVIWRKML